MLRLALFIGVVPVLFTPFVVLAATSRAAEPQLDAVVAATKKFVDSGDVSGVVTLVAENGKVVHLAAAGLADVDKKTPMTVDAPFAIASMTKPITATALMTLVEEGKISLEDPVEKHLPKFADARLAGGEPVKGLLVRHLLTHTSGVYSDLDVDGSLEKAADQLAGRPFDFQPGTKWKYSLSHHVCGRLIEVVSGKSYADYVDDRILRPLGMTSTTFHPSPEVLATVPVCYDRGPGGKLVAAKRPFATGDPAEQPNPSGGLFSTARDLDRFYQMILGGGELDGVRILSAASVKTMTTRQTPDDLVTGFTPGNGWGFGWCVIREPQGVTASLSPGSFGHGGFYGTQGTIDPVKKRIYVLLYQRMGLPNSDGAEIRKEFYDAAAGSLDEK